MLVALSPKGLGTLVAFTASTDGDRLVPFKLTGNVDTMDLLICIEWSVLRVTVFPKTNRSLCLCAALRDVQCTNHLRFDRPNMSTAAQVFRCSIRLITDLEVSDESIARTL